MKFSKRKDVCWEFWPTTNFFFKTGVSACFQSCINGKGVTPVAIEFSRLYCSTFLSRHFISFLSRTEVDRIVLFADSTLYPLALYYRSITTRVYIIHENESLDEIRFKLEQAPQRTFFSVKNKLSEKEFFLLKYLSRGETISSISRASGESRKTLYSRHRSICKKMKIVEVKRISIF